VVPGTHSKQFALNALISIRTIHRMARAVKIKDKKRF
jgi:hypothetical protein